MSHADDFVLGYLKSDARALYVVSMQQAEELVRLRAELDALHTAAEVFAAAFSLDTKTGKCSPIYDDDGVRIGELWTTLGDALDGCAAARVLGDKP